MLTVIGLLILVLILGISAIRYAHSLKPKPIENHFPKIWGMNGYKHHEYKDVNF